MIPFDPLFRNPHVQTIAGHLWRRSGEEHRFPLRRRLVRTEPDVEVLVQSQLPEGPPAGDIVMVHGLEGSGEAGYVRSLSGAALRAGFAAHRFHMRTCGGTERLCRTLYHAGLTSDLLAVLRVFQREGRGPAFLVGFSLGGNVVLKLAGELAEAACPLIRGVCAVSSPLDLAVCARRIAGKDNRLYERRFVRRMRSRLCATGRYREADFAGLASVMEIDDRITAPSFGFGDAATYYRTQSANRFLEGIRVPALVIHSQDDTLAPFASVAMEAARCHPRIELLVTAHGGHLGFIGRAPHRFWADAAILDWIARQHRASA
ncbi:MAG: alpha/beta fold hydrolase [Acidobacteriia bacterium]|nr:alpha/beta fold hydrolase [Terriglobia bacterium]